MEKFIIKISDKNGMDYFPMDGEYLTDWWRGAKFFDTKEAAEKIDIAPYIEEMKRRPDIFHIDIETCKSEIVAVKIRDTENNGGGFFDEVCRRDFYADIHGIYEP